jgi:hypothetical protein
MWSTNSSIRSCAASKIAGLLQVNRRMTRRAFVSRAIATQVAAPRMVRAGAAAPICTYAAHTDGH